MLRPLVLVPLLASPALADVIFNSHQPHASGGQGAIWLMTDRALLEPSSTTEYAGGFETEGRVGASITFGGSARYLTTVEVLCTSFFGYTNAQITLALYADAGGQPGALIWSGAQQVLTGVQGASNAVFTPDRVVPDAIFYAITYTNIALPNRDFGVYVTQAAPTAGSAGQLMTQDSVTLAWAPAGFTTPAHKLELRFTAAALGCYPNCDNSTAVPVLNVADFTCFLQAFASGCR